MPVMDDADRILDEATDWLLVMAESPHDPDAQAGLRQWLAVDVRHAEMWRELNLSYDLIGQVEQNEEEESGASLPPPYRRRGKRFRYHASAEPRRGLVRAMAGLAAALVALWAAPDLLMYLRADHRTGTGELRTVALQDGSTVQLGPGSAIRVDFSTGGRRIDLLAGEALFQVRPNPHLPFRVHAGEVTTTVLGTGFDVRRQRDATFVGVQHGRVRVDGGDGSQEPQFLSAGDELRLSHDGVIRRDHGSPALVASWALGEVVARDRTVGEVIDDIRPWFNGQIIVMDSDLASRRINGVYNPRNAVQAIRSVLGPGGGRLIQITPWLLLVRA